MQTMKTVRKEDMDKAAWSWADTTEPKDVTKEHVELSYRIKLGVCGPNSCRYVYGMTLDKKQAVLEFIIFFLTHNLKLLSLNILVYIWCVLLAFCSV
jgi:hypothetical protein